MSMGNNQRNSGFGIVAAALVLVCVLVVAGAGYAVYRAWHNALPRRSSTSKSSSSSQSSPTQVATDVYAGWHEYCSTVGGLCLKYPSAWQVDDQSANGGPTVIANASKSVAITYNPTPQIGGACQSGCYFTQDSLVPVATANSLGLEVLTGVWENTAHALIQPDLELVSSSALSQYHLVPGQKVSVGFFAPVVMSPVKSGAIETLTVNPTPANNFSSYADARAWLQQPDVLTAKDILASTFVK